MARMTRLSRESLTIRAVVVLGFVLTIGLWALTGYTLSRQMSDAQSRSLAMNAHYLGAQNQLSAVRADVLLAATYARDSLLDPDLTAADYQSMIDGALRRADDSLRSYEPALDSTAERQRLEQIRRHVNVLRATLHTVPLQSRDLTRQEALRLLRRDVTPARQNAIAVTEEAIRANRSAFVALQNATGEAYARAQTTLWQALGLALAASIGIGLLATLYAGRLEGRLRRQRQRDIQVTDDLQHLAAELVEVQDNERRTIARELHDEVGQALLAMKVEVAVVRRELAAAGSTADALTDLEALADGALATVRDLSRLLHPSVLDDLGLPAAVEAYLAGFSRRHGVRTELTRDNVDQRLAPPLESAAYRIIQEALSNVARHARASRCLITLRRRDERLLIVVEDDGSGFPPAASSPRRGLGLIGIRERVDHFSGTFRIVTAPGKGTRLEIELPWQARGAVAEVPEDVSRLTGAYAGAAT